MSRLAKKPVPVPAGVNVTIEGNSLSMKGPKGELQRSLPSVVKASLSTDGRGLEIAFASATREGRMMAGTTTSLLRNMVQGVTQGYEKALEVVGAGYSAKVEGKQLLLQVGYCEPRRMAIPEGLKVETPSATRIVVRGCDNQQVGEFAAEIRRVRPPEPYKGKGIKYEGEQMRRKAGKAFVSGK